MAWNGTGTFSRTNGDNTGSTLWNQDKLDGDKITAARHDTHDQDLADGINACLAKNGENAMTGNLDMGGFDLTNWTIASDKSFGLNNITNVADMQSDTVTTGSATFSGTITVDTNITGPYATLTDTLTLTGATVAGGPTHTGNPTFSGNVTFSNILTVTGVIKLPTSTPASAGAVGAAGTITYDSDYIYICVADDTWKRVAIATW